MKRDIFAFASFFPFVLFLLLLFFPLEEAKRERTIFLSDNSHRFPAFSLHGNFTISLNQMNST